MIYKRRPSHQLRPPCLPSYGVGWTLLTILQLFERRKQQKGKKDIIVSYNLNTHPIKSGPYHYERKGSHYLPRWLLNAWFLRRCHSVFFSLQVPSSSIIRQTVRHFLSAHCLLTCAQYQEDENKSYGHSGRRFQIWKKKKRKSNTSGESYTLPCFKFNSHFQNVFP